MTSLIILLTLIGLRFVLFWIIFLIMPQVAEVISKKIFPWAW